MPPPSSIALLGLPSLLPKYLGEGRRGSLPLASTVLPPLYPCATVYRNSCVGPVLSPSKGVCAPVSLCVSGRELSGGAGSYASPI